MNLLLLGRTTGFERSNRRFAELTLCMFSEFLMEFRQMAIHGDRAVSSKD